jgi:hypothetical protein
MMMVSPCRKLFITVFVFVSILASTGCMRSVPTMFDGEVGARIENGESYESIRRYLTERWIRAAHEYGEVMFETVRSTTLLAAPYQDKRPPRSLAPGTRLVFRSPYRIEGASIFVEVRARKGMLLVHEVNGWIKKADIVKYPADIFGYLDRPLISLSQLELHQTPDQSSQIVGTVPSSYKLARESDTGMYVKVNTGSVQGWVPARMVRIARSRERNKAYVVAFNFAVEHVFPEKTLSGKALGILTGFSISFILSLLFVRHRSWERFNRAKSLVLFLYFGFKNAAVFMQMSPNEKIIFVFVMCILAECIDTATDQIVRRRLK